MGSRLPRVRQRTEADSDDSPTSQSLPRTHNSQCVKEQRQIVVIVQLLNLYLELTTAAHPNYRQIPLLISYLVSSLYQTLIRGSAGNIWPGVQGQVGSSGKALIGGL